jgi:hypothetical protein
MEGIKVTRLSGIQPGTDYKRIDGIGHTQDSNTVQLGREFDSLGCTCQSLGNCSENQLTTQLLREFEQRVKNHLINTYNYIVKNRAASGIQNPDAVALAYKKIIDNWEDRTARENAMLEAEKLIQNDEQIARDFAGKMAKENQMRSAVLVKLRHSQVPTMTARRRAVVMNGLGNVGEVDYEILPDHVQTLGTVIEDFSAMGLAGQSSDVTVSLGSTMVPYNEVDLHGTDPNDTVYVLSGVDKKGKKVQVKITPKNAVKKVRQGVKAVAKAATVAAQKTGIVAKKAAEKTKEFAKKAGKAIVKYNPLFVAGRAGFLLAAKLNLKNIARKMMWGYASLAQAQKAGFTAADWKKSKAAIKKVEDIFVRTAGGNANALRKAVLSSHVAKKAGLGDPATAAAIAAAMPLILAIVAALRDVKVAQAGSAPKLDTDGAGGDNMSADGAASNEIEQKSEADYQNVSDKNSADSSASGNQSTYKDTEVGPDSGANSKVVNDNPKPGDDSGKNGSNTGLIMGGLALGIFGLIAFSANRSTGKTNGLNGTRETSKPKVIVEKFIIN